jgi:hypothetical protein
LSAISWQTLAISARTSNTTRSMLRRIARSPRGAHHAGRLDNDASDLVADHARTYRWLNPVANDPNADLIPTLAQKC